MFYSVSLFHVVLISLERFLAIKRPFFYNNYSSNKILIISSAIAWILAFIPAIKDFIDSEHDFVTVVFVEVILVCSLLVIVVCHVSIYIEARRHEKQIASQQVSLEAREKFKRERKTLKTTMPIVLTVFFCNFISISVNFFLDKVTEFNVAHILFFLAFTLTLLNSLMNPLIYAERNRRFRLVFVHLLLRKRVQQTEETEIRVICCRRSTVRPQAGDTQELP
ncbi:trace amine-associated receptor 6-like [Stylophora pistillata]|uniref:trace amine-associated receptor 6-like n=1 Tax=Stylophora pistillata TaxID=50429 RepID=UPI000C0476F7|nr:trace amine-associated receptor 6-like [Stylophora pistillata]